MRVQHLGSARAARGICGVSDAGRRWARDRVVRERVIAAVSNEVTLREPEG